MTESEVTTVRPRPVRYNVGYNSNHSSIMNVSDVLATYSKKVRLLLQKNKQLARKLAASQSKISQQEKANKRQQKIENLALPRIKIWLEAGMQCFHDARFNYERALGLLQDIMNPERDFTLTEAADTDEPSTRKDRTPALRSRGRPCGNEPGNFTVILEESESFIKSRCSSPEMTAPWPGVGQSPTHTMAMSMDRMQDEISFRLLSPLTPLAPSLVAVEPTPSVTEQFGVNQNTILETESMLITTAARVKSGRELDGHNMPPVSSPNDEEADDFHFTEDSPSSRNQFRVPNRPRKSVGNGNGIGSVGSRRRSSLSATVHGRRSSPIDASPESLLSETARSVPAEREVRSDVTLLSPLCALDDAFLETSTCVAMRPSSAVPEKAATSHADDGHTLEAKPTSKKSSRKSRPSTGSAGLGRAPRLSRDVSEGEDQVHASRPGDMGDGPPSAGSTETPREAEKAKSPPAELQTAKTSRRRSRLCAEPVCAPPATDDGSVLRYASGRPARRTSLGKNYKEPSLSDTYFRTYR